VTDHSTVAAGLLCALLVGAGSVRASATTIAEYDRIASAKAKSTFLAGVITTVTGNLVKDLLSPRDANGRSKTREQAARDKARAALVPKAVMGSLGAGTYSDRIGLLALQIAAARTQNSSTQLETVVSRWILEQVTAFEATRSAAEKPR
jgi:hypothetical protein